MAVAKAITTHAEALVGFFGMPTPEGGHTPVNVDVDKWLVENMPFGEDLVFEDEVQP